jgi:monoamine oxidase
MADHFSDIVVIGAGATGLAAASALARSGLQVNILEARGRTGGRVYTVCDPRLPLPTELGAEFVHGGPEQLRSVLRGSALSYYELAGERWTFENCRLAKDPQPS